MAHSPPSPRSPFSPSTRTRTNTHTLIHARKQETATNSWQGDVRMLRTAMKRVLAENESLKAKLKDKQDAPSVKLASARAQLHNAKCVCVRVSERVRVCVRACVHVWLCLCLCVCVG